MGNFEELLKNELDKLPYTKHLDDGQYNDGRLSGFELGARWALSLFSVNVSSEQCKHTDSDLIRFNGSGFKCKCGKEVTFF